MSFSGHRATALPDRPMSIPEIVASAQDFEFDQRRDLRSWLRSSRMLLTEAANCEHDGDYQKAYLYLYRHAELVIAHFPKHPEYKNPELKGDLAKARQDVNNNIAKLEQMKPRINERLRRYTAAVARREAERQRIDEERRGSNGMGQSDDELQRESFDRYQKGYNAFDDSQSLDALEHRQLAVDLAHKELRRRAANRMSTSEAGTSPDTIKRRRAARIVGPGGDDEVVRGGDDQRFDQSGVRETGKLLDGRNHRGRTDETRRPLKGGSSFNYPSVPAKEAAMDWRSQPMSPMPSSTDRWRPPPSVPAKSALDAPPSRPSKTPDRPPKVSTSPEPPHKKFTIATTAYAESGTPLRPLYLPPELRRKFLNLAHDNTSRNLETCGILCGSLVSSALFITHLILPDQNSTSDTCDTTEGGDNALFDYCDKNNLIVCGWIHTHPTQTCFLSSRDLHTSSGYQIMLPEAIAVVCAPRSNPDWGCFRLTDPPGLQTVLKCEKRGLFHPHDDVAGGLYTDALLPGHVVEGPGLNFDVVDMRL
ncbi:hypothetical protein MBLNU230_g1290t1 [Neophaeotheca triangularis]